MASMMSVFILRRPVAALGLQCLTLLLHHCAAIESAIGGNAYQHSKVNQWTTNVVEQTLSQLTKLGKPFKYIGSCTVRWENKTMYCIVSAFGLSI
ncbi:Dynein light chain Tctex-type 1 [Microtus ochrogaster]|uniref:Dynein light chain Tctex-type 1 n=1 Tax=Microtus ochrogaster TaxID=79684 RepID=A0A8J6GT76_MICOH|nr:Dynein light chain Tctex-type 1 [Microtus ochrogaster]